ncbi:hypothetical protein ASF45_12730 [Pseudorhodoferax sp. Leaf265]|nr:hypothetical protein ASF45_12730 [Pseudorhodoferax sp. Leaf265]
MTRRGLLGSIGALAAAASSASLSGCGGAEAATSPSSGELLIKGGRVLALDAAGSQLATGDVHIKNGIIVAVGENITAAGAQEIDATGTVVMPGFVETHWHMWNGLWKGMANDATEYFRLRSLASSYTVQDHYLAVRYAALQALNVGITTCHDWADGVRNYADFAAHMMALSEVGIRAKASYPGTSSGNVTRREDLVQARDWLQSNGQNRIQLGLLLDGAGAQFEQQVRLARELGIAPITNHEGFFNHPNVLGPEFVYTHGTDVSDAEIDAIRSNNIKVALCPTTDPMIGVGLPPVYQLLSKGVKRENMGFSVDVSCQTSPEPFEMMRTLVNASRIQQTGLNAIFDVVRAAPKWIFGYGDALRVATAGGANVLGLSEEVGALAAGKKADVILVRLDDINMQPSAGSNIEYQLVQCGSSHNVDTVIVDGIVRKRHGRLVDVDVKALTRDVAAAQEALKLRGGLS